MTFAADRASSKPILRLWKFASALVPRFVQADSYTVVVPDAEVLDFKRVTAKPFQVQPESVYLAREMRVYLETAMGGARPERVGWYLQQLLKLEAVRRIAQSGSHAIIWDADNVPLRRLELFRSGKIPLLLKGSNLDVHLPYYQHIHDLLGLDRLQPNSFIAQAMPVDPRWIDKLVSLIEARHKKLWWQALVDTTDFNEKSGFSEYEILGSIAFHFYPGTWAWSEEKILRDTRARGQVPSLWFLAGLRRNGYALVSMEGRKLAPFRRLRRLLELWGTSAVRFIKTVKAKRHSAAYAEIAALMRRVDETGGNRLAVLVEANSLSTRARVDSILKIVGSLEEHGLRVTLEIFDPVSSHKGYWNSLCKNFRSQIRSSFFECGSSDVVHFVPVDAIEKHGFDETTTHSLISSSTSRADLVHKIWEVLSASDLEYSNRESLAATLIGAISSCSLKRNEGLSQWSKGNSDAVLVVVDASVGEAQLDALVTCLESKTSCSSLIAFPCLPRALARRVESQFSMSRFTNDVFELYL